MAVQPMTSMLQLGETHERELFGNEVLDLFPDRDHVRRGKMRLDSSPTRPPFEQNISVRRLRAVPLVAQATLVVRNRGRLHFPQKAFVLTFLAGEHALSHHDIDLTLTCLRRLLHSVLQVPVAAICLRGLWTPAAQSSRSSCTVRETLIRMRPTLGMSRTLQRVGSIPWLGVTAARSLRNGHAPSESAGPHRR